MPVLNNKPNATISFTSIQYQQEGEERQAHVGGTTHVT